MFLNDIVDKGFLVFFCNFCDLEFGNLVTGNIWLLLIFSILYSICLLMLFILLISDMYLF